MILNITRLFKILISKIIKNNNNKIVSNSKKIKLKKRLLKSIIRLYNIFALKILENNNNKIISRNKKDKLNKKLFKFKKTKFQKEIRIKSKFLIFKV